MKNYQKIAAGSLGLMLILSPALSYAKENGKDMHGGKDDRIEREAGKECLKAFGHLIARGFIKNKGEDSRSFVGCFVPFGIAKRFMQATSTAPADITAPVVSDISVNAATTTALLTWQTDEPAASKIWYGTSSPITAGATSTLSLSTSTFTKLHAAFLGDLASSTTYYFLIESRDKSGNVSTSSQSSFLTK